MSVVSSPGLVRLQELKLWQGNYDNLFKKNSETDSSDVETLEGVISLNNSRSIENPMKTPSKVIDWDKKTITPTKSFSELLEEKLADDYPKTVSSKPKQPFLRKGSGLARFNLDKNIIPLKPSIKKTKKNKINQNTNNSNSNNKPHREEREENEPIPLKLPEVSITCKATWSKVIQNDTNVSNTQSPLHKIDENFVEKIKQFNVNSFFSNVNEERLNRETSESFDQTKSDRELQLFEALEEKVEHSSFSSANSSIIRLLSSTPKSNSLNDSSKCNSEVLLRILQNLKLLSIPNPDEENDVIKRRDSNRVSTSSETDPDEKWSHNSDSSRNSPTSFYTEFENTLEKPERTEAAVNTSFNDKTPVNTQTQFSQCFGCLEYKRKLEKLEADMPNIMAEKAKLCDFAKELERKRDELKEETEYIKKRYEKDIEDLREELEKEKNKYTRDKMLLDMYQKDSKPSKQEREQIISLKNEIIDLKELIKLKDTKNGTTLASLRNQIKRLEKEKSELTTSLENLQKENAKLTASQKVQRSTDTKMLKEINRNLYRLTEETKQLKCDKVEETNNKPKKTRRKSMGDVKEKPEKKLREQVNKTVNIPNSSKSPESSEDEDSLIESPMVEVLYNNNKILQKNVEKQYNSTFGDSRENVDYSNMNESRKDPSAILLEKEYPDGSHEIKYANGASKIISPCGKFIYVQYSNGDIKETNLIKNIKKYYFAEKDIWLTKYTDGIELVEFPNGQKEKKYSDGRVEVSTAEGIEIIKYPDGRKEVNYPDGSRMVNSENEKVIYLPNGQKETHTKEYKKREYPDGTVKLLYPDGTQESRYVNGRIRVKSADGTLLLDSQSS